jgi:hypothetical protein
LGNVITINDDRIKSHLDRVVRGVEETLSVLLDAEADRLCNAQRYERSEARRDTAPATASLGRDRLGPVTRPPRTRRHAQIRDGAP